MSRGAKIATGLGLAFIILVVSVVGYVVSAKLTPERYEQSVFAQDESMQSTWGMMEQMLSTNGFTVKNYGKTFIDTIKANAIRYENDKNAMMKWVQESANQMSPAIHQKFMDTVEKVYAKKEAKQLSKISVVQEYRTYLNATVKGMVSTSFFNYPTAKAQKIMDRIITTKGARDTWESGTEAPVTDPFAS
jgi:hypothetical protein